MLSAKVVSCSHLDGNLGQKPTLAETMAMLSTEVAFWVHECENLGTKATLVETMPPAPPLASLRAARFPRSQCCPGRYHNASPHQALVLPQNWTTPLDS